MYSNLTLLSGWRMTATGVHSLPVPAVVGTAMNGTRSPRGRFSQPIRPRMSSVRWPISSLTPLAVSSTEPPPSATMPSQP